MRQVGQEVVSDEESHEDEIVDDTLHVECDTLVDLRIFQFLEFQLEIFAHNAKMHQIEVLVFQLLALSFRLAAESDLLTQQREVRVMRQQPKHDQVGIQTVQTVTNVGVVVRLTLRLADVFHDLVFALTGDFMARQDDFTALPLDILAHLLGDEVFELLRQARHELGTGCDTVRVKRRFLRQLDALFDGLFTGHLSIERGTETSGTLLVHLGARRDTIDGHEEELLRLDLAKQMLDVIEDLDEHLVFRSMLSS